MKLYSTNHAHHVVSLREAVFHSLPPDGGLYMPVKIPVLPSAFIDSLQSLSFQEIALHICRTFLEESLSHSEIEHIILRSINFPAPVISLNPQFHILELFHGPSLAFKDFGARFMAELMSILNQGEDRELTILVATSGDTGGAVAAGFYKTEGIRVIILYPKGKVSPLQEQQLVTWGENIEAVEVEGSFDDCQAMVKKAFLDADLNQKIRLTSANSINIARLIPQSFYYFEGYKQVVDHRTRENIVFSVPSGNYGNLTAGLFARKMGLPVKHFIAASNLNDSVPRYLESSQFGPGETFQTISNAMDVGNPSNFQRMIDLFHHNKDESSTWNNMKKVICGYVFDDLQTKVEIRRIYADYDYILDPHGAVGSLAWRSYKKDHPGSCGIVLETAHPSKFLDIIEPVLGLKVEIPERLSNLAKKDKKSVCMAPRFNDFKNWLLSRNV